MYVWCRHEESVIDGRGKEVGDPFITGRASGGGGMTLALVDDIRDLLADYCNPETILFILCTIAFAIYIELYITPNYYS